MDHARNGRQSGAPDFRQELPEIRRRFRTNLEFSRTETPVTSSRKNCYRPVAARGEPGNDFLRQAGPVGQEHPRPRGCATRDVVDANCRLVVPRLGFADEEN